MGLEHDEAQQYREVPDKYVSPNADYEMTTFDYVVRPNAQGAGGPITITLPRVAEARGRWYSIVCRAASGVNTVTVQDRNDSECWNGDIVMNAKCDHALCYSDGLKWYVFTGICLGATTTGPPGTATATTVAPTTLGTTAAPTTLLTTTPPTTPAPTTAAPTTVEQGTTAAPTTPAPTTLAPTTLAPTTAAPTTTATTAPPTTT